MLNQRVRRRLMAGTIIAGAVIFSNAAIAQSTPDALPNKAKSADSDVIIVTGSRIQSPNLTSAAPVTVVSAQDVKLTGTTRVEDLLNALPQVFAGQASTLSNGADGTATVDLRGLGPRRTLVLVNGRRLLPGDPTTSAADINAIPAALIKRIDVLTGGASATYGADAVSGVVNFIMDTNFTGIKFDGQISTYQHNNTDTTLTPALDARTASGLVGYGYPRGNSVDGRATDATLTIGSAFGDNRGHVTAYAGYRKVNPITQDQRDYSSCVLQNVNPAGGAKPSQAQLDAARANIRCGGSGTSAEGNFVDGTSNSYHVAAGRTFAPGFTRYNFAPTNYYQRPDERYTAGLFAHYDVSDAFKPYLEAMFMDDRTIAQIAPSGDFGNTKTVNCDNPLLSASQLGLVCTPANLITGFTTATATAPASPLSGYTNPGAPLWFDGKTGALTNGTGLVQTPGSYNEGYMQLLRRNVEGGPRIDDREHTEIRGVIGAKGDLGSVWSYDTYYQYGRTTLNETYSNDLSVIKLNRALDVVTAPNGTVECRSVLNGTDPACVPYNVFTLGSVTPAAATYLQGIGQQHGVNEEQVANASFTGKLGKYGIKSPFAEEGVLINVGAEYRRESLVLNANQEFRLGDLAGQGAPTLNIAGKLNVVEAFGEVQVPIVRGGAIYDLSFNGGYRVSHYTTSGTDDTGKISSNKFDTGTYKLELEFAPIKDIRFRASLNRASRAPNLQELYATGRTALDGTSDPCSGGSPTASLAACQLSGVTAAQYGKITPNPAAQYNGFLGGNANLTPEKATTKTLGVVLQPRFAPRLALSVDYYDIKITNAITTIGADNIINACVNGVAVACKLVHRSPSNGSLWLGADGFITDTELNIGGQSTRGIDFNGSYSSKLGTLGTLSLSFVGTALQNLKTDTGLAGTPYDCVGLFGANCGTPNPKWRHQARVSFNTNGGVGLSLRWRYFAAVNVDYTSTNAILNNPAYSTFGSHINPQSYFDLASTFSVAKRFTLRLGANNLLDKSPPLVTSGASGGKVPSSCAGTVCNGNTYPAVYEALGRYLYANVTVQF